VREKQDTFNQAWQALRNTVSAAYSLAPAVVIVGLILLSILIYISLYFVEMMMGSIIILIFFISIAVYAASNDYGEAVLALVAGLLAAFTVQWTWNKYVAFIIPLIFFFFFILLTMSIRLAAKNESLYLQAAIYIDVTKSKEIESKLRKLADGMPTRTLGPIDKADAIRIMAFRKIPIESMKYMLGTVEIISGITNLDAKSVTLFLIDLSNAFNIDIGPNFQKEIDKIFNFYRDAPISHEEFIQAFKNSKRLLISNRVEPADYLLMLKLGLTKGVSPEDINDFIQEKITTRQ
jgi:predicted membrane protein